MPRYIKRTFTAEAIAIGCLFSFVVGFVVAMATAIVTQSLGFAAWVGGFMCLFSMDVIFRGRNE